MDGLLALVHEELRVFTECAVPLMAWGSTA
jgi:hypothetical protein